MSRELKLTDEHPSIAEPRSQDTGFASPSAVSMPNIAIFQEVVMRAVKARVEKQSIGPKHHQWAATAENWVGNRVPDA